MKINKNKGKVYPSPSSSSSSPWSSSSSSSSSVQSDSSSLKRDALSVLNKVLPAAVFALTVVLSLEDREVLAYMITRSMKAVNPSSIVQDSKNSKNKKNNEKPCHSNGKALFDCDCFDCYTSFWFRWDSSPNRERIHQAIEAFEDHLSNGEQCSKRNGKGKKKVRQPEDLPDYCESGQPEMASPEAVGLEVFSPGTVETCIAEAPPASLSPEKHDVVSEEAVAVRSAAANNMRGLTGKVFPDVLGLLNSRLWSLWGPNA